MPAKRVLISIDERLLARIDEACARRGLSRSRYLAQLADADLAGARGPGSDPSVRAALATLDELLGEARR
jgi:metal-responsive CopG/Arc/MetJ family transcriptional regulator